MSYKAYIYDQVSPNYVVKDGKWVDSRLSDPDYYTNEAEAQKVIDGTWTIIFEPVIGIVRTGNKAAQGAGKVGEI